MTTWMTPVGVALIVGGITTLIVFRRFLFGAGSEPGDQQDSVRPEPAARAPKRARDDAPRGVPANAARGEERGRRRGVTTRGRRAAAVPAPERPAPASDATVEAVTAALHAPGRGVGRRLSPERSTGGRAVAMPPREPEQHRPEIGAAAAAVPPRDLWPLTKRADDDEARPSRMDPSAYDDYGMAALGFTAHEDMDWLAGRDARAEAEVPTPGDRDGRAAPEEGDFPAVRDTDGAGVLPAVESRIEHGRADIVPPPARRTRADVVLPPARRTRADRRHGDRIDGWVRPEYRDEPATGDYWTPVPDAGYGWPTPVERLPQVPPPVPPAADPGPDPESEPTALVPQLPPMPPPVGQAPPPAWPPHNPGHTGTGRFLPLDARPPLSAFPDTPIPTSPAQAARGNLPSERGSLQSGRGNLPSDRGNPPSERGSLPPGRGNQRPGRGNAPLDADGPQQNAPRGNPGGRRGGRSPVRRPEGNARQTRTFAGRAESAEGPIWTVPDLPDAAMPDLSWTPQRDEPRGTRRGPAALARRGRDGERPAPADARTADQRPRPRPSPRPRPGTDPAPVPEPHSNVYVSRHAAEPT